MGAERSERSETLPTLFQRHEAPESPAGSAVCDIGRRGTRKLCRPCPGDQCFGHQCFRRPIKRPVSLRWEGTTPWRIFVIAGSAQLQLRIFVDHTAYERHWSGALPAMTFESLRHAGE